MIYLPTSVHRQVLSPWTGQPAGFTIDPIGVEAVPAVPGAGPDARVQVLVHLDMQPERIRSWQQHLLVQRLVRAEVGDAVAGDDFHRLVDEREASVADRAWVDGVVVVDAVAVTAAIWELAPTLWAVYTELGEDRIALVGSDVPRGLVALRTASTEEARALRTEALRV